MHCQGRSMAHHLHYTDLTAEREREREMGEMEGGGEIDREQRREERTGKRGERGKMEGWTEVRNGEFEGQKINYS